MTSTADIVIIGGGVHGASLTFHLARAGAGKVVLLEKNHLAAGPTSRSGAMIRPLFTEETYVRLVIASTRMFENWDELVGVGDAGFVQNGFLRITPSLDTETIGGNLGLVRQADEPFEVLGADRLPELAPTGEFRGGEVGLLFPRGGFADPVVTTLNLAEAARRLGAEVIEGTQVTDIEVEQGRVRSVVTDQGRVETPIVVNCAGSWSHRVAALAGVELPISIHRTPTCLFRWPETMRIQGPILSDGVNRVYLRALGDVLLRAAHFGWAPDPADPDAYDETVRTDQIDVLRSGLHRRYDAMRRTVFCGGFAALYDMTPDGHPIIGEMAAVDGFWCNCGWSGNGFASAPAVGRCLAQMIMGQASDVDLRLFAWPRGDDVQDRADMKWVYR